MKQVIQNYKSGELQLVEVPDPVVRPGGVVVQAKNSLVSVGTEKLMIELAQKGYLGKALARPDLVRQVINKIKVDGLSDTYKAVMSRLDSPTTLGYSSAGLVTQVGGSLIGAKVGERIACFGDGFATHSELSFVPQNMFVPIPENVGFEEAAFVGLGAIALNAIRLGELTFGEKVGVIGLGLLGQLAVQMLKAFGCRVIGMDISEAKLKMASKFGADKCVRADKEEALNAALEFTHGAGLDAVIIMAGSQDNKPIELAAELSRNKGRIVACGMISLNVPRQEFFKKELSVIVSRATGPGKFDPLYENRGRDYPLPYVRWTSQRNMGCFLDLVSQGKISLKGLISHRYQIENALLAYEMILKNDQPYLGVLIEYGVDRAPASKVVLRSRRENSRINKEVGVGLIGAGLHANTSLLPILKNLKGIELVGIADIEGVKGRHSGMKYGFEYCVNDYRELLKDPTIDSVMIATRHNTHAQIVIDSFLAGKHVFVEKPLAMNIDELQKIRIAQEQSNRQLMVGFNRRFAPLSELAKEKMGKVSNAVINCRVNAGFVPADSWVFDSAEGGGRVVGEVCHFIDLIQYLSNSKPVKVFAESTGDKGEDNLVISLKMGNGSAASILYSSQGDRLLPRERIEMFCGQSVCVIDNFRSFFFAKDGRVQKKSSWSVDRGYAKEFAAFIAGLKDGTPPVDYNEYIYTTLATFAVIDSLNTGKPQIIHDH